MRMPVMESFPRPLQHHCDDCVCAPQYHLWAVQGAFRQVAVEADACAKDLTQILKQRMVTQKDEAAECIQMVRKLGEPIESLQVPPCLPFTPLWFSFLFTPSCLFPWPL
jgi:hypothetical protein